MTAVLHYVRHHLASLISIGVRIMGVVLGFIITLFIGREMGAEANGHYGLYTQTAMFLSVIAVGGLDLAVVRDYSAAIPRRIKPARSAFFRLCLVSLGLMALIIGGVAVAGPWLPIDLEAQDAPANAMAILAVLFMTRTVTRLTSAFLRSQRVYTLSQIVEVMIIPGLVVIAILLQAAPTLDTLLYWTCGAGLVGTALGLGASLRRTSTEAGSLDVPVRSTMKTAMPLWGVSISKNLGDWYGLAVVAAILSVYDAGLFRVAFQVGSALAIITLGVFSVFSPQMGSAYATGDYQRIAQLTRSATMLSIALVIPVTLVILIAAEPIMAIFGAEFRNGSLLLQVIVAGQAAYVCTGPAGLTLAMTGHERVNLLLTLGNLLLLLIAVPLAATFGGLLGVGLAISVVQISRNVVSTIAVRRLLGITIITGRYRPVPGHAGAP